MADQIGQKKNSQRGLLIAIGGAEDKKLKKLVLSRMVNAFGAAQARIAIITTASLQPDDAFKMYQSIFLDMGVETIKNVDVTSRKQANAPKAAALLDDVTGIFITGGNQVRLSSILGGTKLVEKIREKFLAGTTVAGTSAGASIMSQHMIAFGRNGATPNLRKLQLAPGFGFINSIIIDQHFRERDRIGRLKTAIVLNPRLIGIGIDENTAIMIRQDDVFEVVGTGGVTVVDGSKIEYTDVHKIKRHSPITVVGMVMHVLGQEYAFDLKTRTPQFPDKS
jgi:cyanophycinase